MVQHYFMLYLYDLAEVILHTAIANIDTYLANSQTSEKSNMLMTKD